MQFTKRNGNGSHEREGNRQERIFLIGTRRAKRKSSSSDPVYKVFKLLAQTVELQPYVLHTLHYGAAAPAFCWLRCLLHPVCLRHVVCEL